MANHPKENQANQKNIKTLDKKSSKVELNENNKKHTKAGIIIGVIALFFTVVTLNGIGSSNSGVGSFACFLGVVAAVFELPVFLDSRKTRENYQKSIIAMVLISIAILGSLIAIIADGVVVNNKKQVIVEKCKTSLENLEYDDECHYKLKREDEGYYDGNDFIKKCQEKGGEIIKSAYYKNAHNSYKCKEEVEKNADSKKREEVEVSKPKNECETNGGQWQYDNTCKSKEKVAEEKEASRQECAKKQNYTWDGDNCNGKEWIWQGNESALNSDSKVSSYEKKITNEVFNAVERKSKSAYILDSGDGKPWTVTIKMTGNSMSEYTVVFYIQGGGSVYRAIVKNGTIIN